MKTKKRFMMMLVLLMSAATYTWGMQIYISYPSWPSGTIVNGAGNLEIEIEGSDSGENLKAKIEDKTGFNLTYQHLFFNSTEIDNSEVLGNYGITSNSVLTLTYDQTVNKKEMVVEVEPAVYDGTVKTPVVKVIDTAKPTDEQVLTEGTDYTVTYKTNDGDPTHPNYINAKNYDKDIIVTGIGEYAGVRYGDFKVTPRHISEVTIGGNELAWQEAGWTTDAIANAITAVYNSITLVQGADKDFTVTVAPDPTGKDYKNAGIYEKVITVAAVEATDNAPKNYAGSVKLNLSIVGGAVEIEENYTIIATDVYTGGNLPPTTTNTKVYYGSTLLEADKDYTFAFTGAASDYKNVGIYENAVVINGKGKYHGTITNSYTITQRSMNDTKLVVTVNNAEAKLPYNGADQNVTVTVQYNNGTDPAIDIPAENFDFSPKTVKEVGDYDIVITAKDNMNLVGAVTKVLQVTGKNMETYAAQFTIDPNEIPTQIWDGVNNVEPTVTITDNDTKEVLVKDTHYTLTYADNAAEGTGKLTITGKDPYYTGTLTREFKIVKEYFAESTFSYHTTSATTVALGKEDKTSAVPIPPTDVEIPATVSHNGVTFTVTGIDEGAFKSSELTSVTLPATITAIQPGAFEGATQLRYILMQTAKDFMTSSLSRTYAKGSVNAKAKKSAPDLSRTSVKSPFYGIPKQTLVYLHTPMAPGENYVFYDGSTYISDKFVIYDDLSGKQTQFQDAGDHLWMIEVPIAFRANNVQNQRMLTAGQLYTTCLPYGMKLPATLELYDLTSSSTSVLGFETKEGTVTTEAYKPYLVKALSNGALLSAKNVDVAASPAMTTIYKLPYTTADEPVGNGEAHFYGTMRYLDDSTTPSVSSLSIYIMQADGNWGLISTASDYNGGTGICILPMRGYIKMGSAMAARQLTGTYSNGIEELNNTEELNAPVYNVQGMKIDRSRAHGLVIVGGKKVVVK